MRLHHRPWLALLPFAVGALALLAGAASGASRAPVFSAAGESFDTWSEYYASDYFADTGKRCGKPKSVAPATAAPSDCSFSFTNPSSEYDTVDIYEIPVVVHIIEHSNGSGQISDALVHSQIDVLNEDFRALAGTPGAPGYDVGIQFVLASTDPAGNPTTGITRTVNDTWFADGGGYWNTLAWDTARYMNVYTNQAGGNLGYVPNLPQGGLAGDPSDRIVILWSAFGRGASGGPPYDQGRTLTHEVGHYLGLEHTFDGGCAGATAPGCYSTGDLVCDTASEANPNYGCPAGAASCGSSDPIENYMDYSDDTCMELFTAEQSHHMRCSLLGYRSTLYSIASSAVCGNDLAEPGEACDGTDDAACPGACLATCRCPTACGDGTCDAGEDAASCPADCGCGAAGACGGQAPGGCFCDGGCAAFGDCCSDACAACAVGCPVLPSCGPVPIVPCRQTAALGASLIIKDDAGGAKDKLVLKIRRGDATATADFLNPLAPGRVASLCVYDSSGAPQPLLAAAVAGGGTCGNKACWKALSTKGFRYANKSGDPAGLTSVKLKEGGDGKAQVQAKARGSLLGPPSPPLQLPVTVQFLVDDGVTTGCWQSDFSVALKNEPGLLKAKGP